MDQLDWIVTGIKKENEATKTFYLMMDGADLIQYHPGQFLTFLFRHNQHELRRSYSFSSAPGIDPQPSVTIKRIPNGEISRYFHDHISPGDKLKSLRPAGRFTVDGGADSPQQLFFIAGGSGIVPIFSLIKHVLSTESLSEIILLNQNHDEESVIFSGQLNEWQSRFPHRFRIFNFLSSPLEKSLGTHRLTNELLETTIGKWKNPDCETLFYLCGPESFMRMAQFTLKLMGMNDRQIRREYFTVQFVPPPPLALDPLPKNVHISMPGREFEFESLYPNTILQSALDHGIQIPYSCRGARCSTCMAKCVSGKVRMSMNEVLTDQDLEQGWILTCVGYAATDVSLSFEA